MKYLSFLWIVLFTLSTATGQSSPGVTSESYNNLIPARSKSSSETGVAKNIILLIGDGMGLSQISSAFYFKNSIPNYARFENIGLMRTSSTVKITDSAAGATAFSAGKKTYNGAIGVDADTLAIPTIVEILSREQWNTGLISTSSITHATPASFYAHVKMRSMEEDIAFQLTTSEVDFIAGGGTGYFTDSLRADGQDLLLSLKTNGFEVSTESFGRRNTTPPRNMPICLVIRPYLPCCRVAAVFLRMPWKWPSTTFLRKG